MGKWVVRAIVSYVLPIVLGGFVGGLVVGAFYVWPTALGAKWWEVFTAIGTVAAAAFAGCAAYVAVKISNSEREERVRENKERALDYLLTNELVFTVLLHELEQLKKNVLYSKQAACTKSFETAYQAYKSIDRGRLRSISLELGQRVRDFDRKINAYWILRGISKGLSEDRILIAVNAAHDLVNTVRFTVSDALEH